MDVKSTFLNGYLQEEVYVEQFLGFKNSNLLNHVYKLQKNPYMDYNKHHGMKD